MEIKVLYYKLGYKKQARVVAKAYTEHSYYRAALSSRLDSYSGLILLTMLH